MLISGEEPITSFFPRVTAVSKKRKENTEPAFAVHKRRREDAQTSKQSSHVTEKGKNRQTDAWMPRSNDDPCSGASKNVPHSSNEVTPVLPRKTGVRLYQSPQRKPQQKSLDSSLPFISCTPKSLSRNSRRKQQSLQTPSTTSPTSRQRTTVSKQPLPSSQSPKQISTAGLYRATTACLPTPTTLPRPSLRRKRPVSCVDEPLQRIDVLEMTSAQAHHDHPHGFCRADCERDASMRTANPPPVPSSQSQHMTPFKDDEDSTNAVTLPDSADATWRAIQSKGQHPVAVSRLDTTAVPSSQSQHLFLDETWGHDTASPMSSFEFKLEHSATDLVPSSQSQENELSIPTDRSRRDMCVPFHLFETSFLTFAITRTSNPISRTYHWPQQTPSDRSFSVPIQETTFADMTSLNGGETAESIHAGIESNPESDEDLSPELYANYLAKNPNVIHNPDLRSQACRFSQSLGHDYISSSENTQMEDRRPCQQSEPLLQADLHFALSSLPLEVKEFQDMFGSNDESYPPDFPISLQQRF
ncbi:hypothetical protein B0H34DRAFT_793485 [Crassisporium funariophilum]|nr:hypothetical protein B0H34DRAFT_793485 [Crassisporium funariophilum]